MAQERTLASLREGERARVMALKTRDGMRRRMQDIGLIEGTLVECVQKSPSGDPAAYLIRGALVALRKSDAERVWMERPVGQNPGEERPGGAAAARRAEGSAGRRMV